MKKIMRIVEISTVINNGKIVLSEDLVRNMNLREGERVWFTYLTEAEGIENHEKSFVITPRKIEDMQEEVVIEENFVELGIPVEALEQAGIDEDAELEIMCADNALILVENKKNPEELFSVCAKYGIDSKTVESWLKGEL